MLALTLGAALLLAMVHMLAGKLRFLHVIPRSWWLSMAGGASVAYVFLHLLPELEKGHEVLRGAVAEPLREHPSYIAALAGLAIFYGLERMVLSAPKEPSERAGKVRAPMSIFWIHIGAFAFYNLLIGYLLLHRDESGTANMLLFTLAMALHFVVNDYGLNDHHEEAYARRGRWVLAVAVVMGWGIGVVVEVQEIAIAFLLSFLGGAVILNVLKEELPEERESRFAAFLAGVVGYSLLLLVI